MYVYVYIEFKIEKCVKFFFFISREFFVYDLGLGLINMIILEVFVIFYILECLLI